MTTTLIDEIAAAVRAGQQEAADWGLDSRQYALRIGLHVSPITGARSYKVDSAELIGFIRNTDPRREMGAEKLAELIVAEFRLDEEER